MDPFMIHCKDCEWEYEVNASTALAIGGIHFLSKKHQIEMGPR